MTRYIIIGAGAVGASLAAQFHAAGLAYILVGRGRQIDHIAGHGLSYRRPDGQKTVRLTTAHADTPPPLRPDDVLLLTVKTQDAEAATAFWAWQPVEGGGVSADLPLVTFQNGLASEDIALRRFSRVYAASIKVPARFTEIGEVVVGGAPQPGIITLGRYPGGLDPTAKSIGTDLAAAGYLTEVSEDIRRWKAAKLLHNVTNVVELFANVNARSQEAIAALSGEARVILQAAGFDPAAEEERRVDISGWHVAENSGIERGQQSTWQSFARGASSEVDYLNGEIVRLARLHGLAAPFNAAFQQAAALLARDGGKPGTVALEAVLSLAMTIKG
ncbi:ketopantoate reductase family protein [Rhizobium paknamense]|uniref:2-dehydropantoate 2-reductase n=1 Tax=Rhizobium paknamense TaxID=1206817 RepID=A0ABU0IGH3_9HYPH|nr:2-dehydropantoate 2-reductase N-terminal domain-containing protein [Rhizobium paknamense]MDQ0456728.1 2-dehydropantoate 2-reductase [Rhizobium paknamense]